MGKKLRDGLASTPAAQETANFIVTVARELESLELVQYRQALGVIVYNLAINAMKYTIAGDIRIVARLHQDHISLAVL